LIRRQRRSSPFFIACFDRFGLSARSEKAPIRPVGTAATPDAVNSDCPHSWSHVDQQ
jgi:hypothetical protein